MERQKERLSTDELEDLVAAGVFLFTLLLLHAHGAAFLAQQLRAQVSALYLCVDSAMLCT